MAVRERKFFVGGNWKMNGSVATIDVILKNLKEGKLSPDTGRYAQAAIVVIIIIRYIIR